MVGGCGSKPNTASCSKMTSLTDVCVDYTGSSYTTTDGNAAVSTACAGLGGTYSATTCVATGKMGTCTVSSGVATEQKFYYYTPTYDATSAKTLCSATSGGTWAAAAHLGGLEDGLDDQE